MFEAISRLYKSDPEGFKRFVAVLEQQYYQDLDTWVQAKPEELAKKQGAALATKIFLETFKDVLRRS